MSTADNRIANSLQVGGDHYRSSYQHWDLVADLGFGYFEGQVTKYVCRWYKKNGVEDLQKAVHYASKWIEVMEEKRYYKLYKPLARKVLEEKMQLFREVNRLGTLEAHIVYQCAVSVNVDDATEILRLINELLARATKA